jgi:hypothetical protein
VDEAAATAATEVPTEEVLPTATEEAPAE